MALNILLVFSSAAQTAVGVGSGSYASSIPSAENVPTDNNPVYVLPGVSEPVPTNDWWTPLILQNMYGSTKYHLWAHPLDFTVESYGLGLHFPTEWSGGTDINKQMVIPAPVRVGGAGFAPNTERVKSWGDWTVAFRLSESATKYVDVTIGHGLPFAWLEYTGVSSGQVSTDASATYYNYSGGVQGFPFTGNHFGFQWQGRHYGVFAPAGTNFTLSNGVVSAAFTGSARYLVVAGMPGQSSLATFLQYAFAVPRNSTVSWNYNEGLGELTTIWNLTTQALQGTNTNVLQGFLPHHYKYTTMNFTPNGINYPSARGQVRCAAGNNFQVKYKYNGALTHLPAPQVLAGKPNAYNATQMNTYLNNFSGSNVLLGEANTYTSGKSLTKFARFIANASVLNHSSLNTLKTKLRSALANWFTYSPGEPHTYFAYMNNFKALMGFDVGYGSEQFNDHHFHYGYHVYAAGVLGMSDPTFITQYGEMAKLVAKEYANWDRNDKRFPFFRTFDPWSGHSWANGGYGMNPPIGNNQESTSEAMMSWTGMIQLGLATGDAAMTSAGVFGYVTEAAATNEYWFDRDDENFPASYGPKGKIACIVGGANIEYQTFFGLNPIYVHGIQYIPVMPSSYYLVQNDKFAEAQTEFDFMRSRSVSGGYGDIGSWGDEWNNIALRYASLFNPEWAAANQSALGTDAGEAGLSYYMIHSNRALGRRRFDYFIGATNSGVFYNAELNRYTYCAFNPTSTTKTYNVYQGTTLRGTITVPANSFYSTNTLNGGGGNNAPTVSITSPANNAAFTAPASITINANAADSDGTITQVAFYNGSNLLGTDTSSPYSFNWTGVAAGTYTLTARATDNGGLTTTSTAITVTVNGTAAPNLALNKPVVVSSTETTTTPGSAAVDGNTTSTRWSSAFSDPQWIYVDLGATYNVNRVKVTWEAAYGRDYRVQISGNASTWTDLKTITGNTTLVNDHPGLSGSGRYVRIYGTARGTVYGYSIYELEVYGTTGGGSGVCSGTVANGDYRYEVSTTSGTVNYRFIPQAPIAGSTLAIIYIRVGTGAYAGYNMTASGSDFVFSQAQSNGTALSFYFTYRVGNTATERNSSATPHSYTAGTTCSGSRFSAEAGAEPSESNSFKVYPNPGKGRLVIEAQGLLPGKLTITDAKGAVMAEHVIASEATFSEIDVSALPKGLYLITIRSEEGITTRRFVKE